MYNCVEEPCRVDGVARGWGRIKVGMRGVFGMGWLVDGVGCGDVGNVGWWVWGSRQPRLKGVTFTCCHSFNLSQSSWRGVLP